MATPWSPPGWMKTTGSLVGGALLPALYDAFAGYFVKYIQAYQAAGIPIDYMLKPISESSPHAVTRSTPGIVHRRATSS